MNKITNKSNISLALAVWLADDDYDYINDINTISATTLLKPIREIVLARQNINLTKIADVKDLIPSRMGTAFHTAIESTWQNEEKVKKILTKMGYSDKIVSRVKINPKKEELKKDTIAVYLEIRSFKQFGKFKISGKFDFVMESRLKDYKSTKVYGYIKGSNTIKYIQQGSIYRVLNPELITDDILEIDYIFTDWSKLEYIKNPNNYPHQNLLKKEYKLMSIDETEEFINSILNQIESLEDKPQSQLPLCTKEELWQDDEVYKYYKDPNKRTRSTKNFDNAQEAHDRCNKEGVGIVIEVKGVPRKCSYCSVSEICDQRQGFVTSGLIKL